MKKILAILMALMLCGAFVACGGNEEEATTEEPAAQTEETT